MNDMTPYYNSGKTNGQLTTESESHSSHSSDEDVNHVAEELGTFDR